MRCALLLSTPVLSCISVFAQTAPAPAPTKQDEIVITAPYARSQQDVLQSTSVLKADELARALQSTLGETLARQPGVSSTSFGPGASRPVLRGFQGERIRVLVDGIGSIDVSNTSPDHAVASEPLTATRIEILRGPATLLFGSGAIGGVVNQIDSRIAEGPLATPAMVKAVATYGTAANEVSVGGTVDVQVTPDLIAHVDVSYRNTDDLKIAGFARSEILRDATGGTLPDDGATKGTLLNSATRTRTAAAGLTAVSDSAALGASVSLFESVYGVPDQIGNPETGIQLDVKQVRFDVKGRYDFKGSLIDTVKFRAGYADYRHVELEDTGEIGTRFDNEAWEARLEAVQADRNGWRGAFGAQVFNRDFSVIGEEAFVPPNLTRQYGLFTVQELKTGDWRIEGGARYENTRTKSDDPGIKRSFNTFSFSAGTQYLFSDSVRLGLNLSRTERAPAAEELYANGPHAGTRAFEIGDPDFKTERSLGADGSLHLDFERGHLVVSAFYAKFNNYIYEQETGNIVDDLTEFQFLQARARYYGLELEADATLFEKDDKKIVATVVADMVRATNLDTNRPLPRIPARRLLLGLEGQSAYVDLRGEIEIVGNQKRVTTFELPSRSYEVVSLSATIRPFARARDVSLLLQANNLFNADARRHASFLKDFAPLAGRDFRAALRVGF
jgi:iron complex outermembrane recepter protein